MTSKRGVLESPAAWLSMAQDDAVLAPPAPLFLLGCGHRRRVRRVRGQVGLLSSFGQLLHFIFYDCPPVLREDEVSSERLLEPLTTS